MQCDEVIRETLTAVRTAQSNTNLNRSHFRRITTYHNSKKTIILQDSDREIVGAGEGSGSLVLWQAFLFLSVLADYLHHIFMKRLLLSKTTKTKFLLYLYIINESFKMKTYACISEVIKKKQNSLCQQPHHGCHHMPYA